MIRWILQWKGHAALKWSGRPVAHLFMRWKGGETAFTTATVPVVFESFERVCPSCLCLNDVLSKWNLTASVRVMQSEGMQMVSCIDICLGTRPLSRKLCVCISQVASIAVACKENNNKKRRRKKTPFMSATKSQQVIPLRSYSISSN